MSSFEAIGFNIAVGTVFGVTALFSFNAAIQYKFNRQLAPRTYARPINVIKNVLKGKPYGLRWVPWALRLTYVEMMEGIPGTGTRSDGWSGANLRCNMDSIIMLRFHSLCLRVAVLATILCLGIVLPVNLTAPCDPELVGEDICYNITNLTNFDKTTLANIPQLSLPNEPSTGGIGRYFGRAFHGSPGLTMRLVTIVWVAFAIYTYACVLIWKQWSENLALRRVYYLEYNHYKGRKAELEFLANLTDPEDIIQDDRPPFVPHPELRDTIPNIGLYSVLYKLPPHHYPGVGSVTSSQVGRHLSSAVDFFDRVVPNQPGYSSSVAAVTILPDVNQLARAWKKWYACARKLRRLRYIRRRLRKLRDGQDQRVQIVFESGRTSPLKAGSLNESWSTGEACFRGEERDGAANQSMCDYPEKLPNAANTSSDISPDNINKSQKGITPAPTSSSGFGSKKENGQDVAASPESTTPRRFLETVDEGSVSDSNSEYSCPAEPLCEFDSEAQLSSADGASIKQSTARGQLNEYDRLMSTLSSGSSEHSHDIEEHRLLKPYPTTTSNSSHPSNVLLENSNGRNLTGSLGNGELRNRFLSSVGLHEESKLKYFLSDDDIEQLTVYCHEFARSSARCCTYGCNDSAIRRADAATLADMEQEAEEAVRNAAEELRKARAIVHRADVETETGWLNVRSGGDDSLLEQGVLSKGVDFVEGQANFDDYSKTDLIAEKSLKSTTFNNSGKMNSIAEHWAEAERLLSAEEHSTGLKGFKWHRTLSKGNWSLPVKTPSSLLEETSARAGKLKDIIASGTSKIATTDSYAVVTFTSRQAAIAARQCMVDGSGIERWREVAAIPIPPLADASPCNICDCRGCCRPVTVTLPQESKRWRKVFSITCVVLFCFFYTIPLAAASTVFYSESLLNIIPNLHERERIAGFLSGLLKSVFFAVCPQIFKFLANFSSEAASIEQAEDRAMRYFWFFMLATAFTSTSLATVILEGVIYALDVGGQTQDLLRTVGSIVPTTISAQWLNWIIFRIGITLPYNYLLQFTNFLYRALGWKCCARATAGGGPGGPAPYRIYVDCGVIFLCVVGLAPACPLIAPAAMACYLVVIPMLRWLVIFTYRPQFDGGGLRWPFLHNILISSMIWSQILLAAMMAVKRTYGVSVLAGLAIIPTFYFDVLCRDRFLKSYEDSGLLQTSELDGWNIDETTSMKEREDFRKFLVDCHRASYIPICVNGEGNILTAEPAVVIPTERDDWESGTIQDEMDRVPSPDRITSLDVPIAGGTRQRASTFDSFHSLQSMNSQQHGALFRRVVGSNVALPPVPPPSRLGSIASSATPIRSGAGNSLNVSFQNPPVDTDNYMIASIGRDTREEKSV